jgi:uridine kinase
MKLPFPSHPCSSVFIRGKKKDSAPLLIAIVGGSGSGKTWLAKKLQVALGSNAARISLDDFYRDRSHVSPALRANINFDNPRAIDWAGLENVLNNLLAGRAARLPCYDFKTHCRLAEEKIIEPKPVITVDGLWLLRRASLRRLFALKIFIDCPARTRRSRRLARDLRSRGRTRASVLKQFRKTVEPMHDRFVTPQKRWADVVLRHDFKERVVKQLAEQLHARLNVLRSSKTWEHRRPAGNNVIRRRDVGAPRANE